MIKEQIASLLTYGVDGSAFGARTAVALTTTQVFTISQGFWLVELAGTAAQSITFTPDSGVTTVTYLAGAATGPKTELFADGFSWFIANVGTASNVTLTQIKAMF
jgi:hypothetical protein